MTHELEPLCNVHGDVGGKHECANSPARWQCNGIPSAIRSLLVRQQGSLDVLDGIRALAVLWVIAFHSWSSLATTWAGTRLSDQDKAVLYSSPSLWCIRSGELGVDMFFVLSGFLIGHVLLRECEEPGLVEKRLFFLRRFLRTFPAMALFIACVVPAVIAKGLVSEGCWMVLSLVFLNNFAGPPLNGAHLWSLAVEFQLYLVSPLLVQAMHKSSRPVLLASLPVVASCAISALLTFIYFPSAMDDPSVWQQNFDLYTRVLYTKPYTRMGPYFSGLVAAACTHRSEYHVGARNLAPLLEWSAFFVAIAFGFVGGNPAYASFLPASLRVIQVVCGRTLYGIALAFLLLRSLDPELSLLASHRPPRWIRAALRCRLWTPIARLSYSAYLWHIPAILLVHSAILPHLATSALPLSAQSAFARVAAVFLIGAPIAFALAGLSFFCVEKPCMDARPSRPAAAHEGAAEAGKTDCLPRGHVALKVMSPPPAAHGAVAAEANVLGIMGSIGLGARFDCCGAVANKRSGM